MAAGIGLTALSSTGEVVGVALDATGAGAVVGVPLGAVSTAGIVTGVGIAGAGMGNIAYHATGDDAVELIDTDDSDDLPSQSVEATAWDHVIGDTPNPADIHTPDLKQIHILDGEGDGSGGHVAGTGNPNKTEFPESWDDDKIINTVEDVAKNPDRPPVMSDESGNYKFSGTRDGVEIEGYVTPDGQVQTGYPVRGEGVLRNDEFGNPHPVP
ncbi:EndoU domain-containing protein [Saccharopolyspora phatthalungensis]